MRYLGRLSGPVADRIDMHYWVKADEPNEDVNAVEERICNVWELQKSRWESEGFVHAGHIPGERVDELVEVSGSVRKLLDDSVEKAGFHVEKDTKSCV